MTRIALTFLGIAVPLILIYDILWPVARLLIFGGP